MRIDVMSQMRGIDEFSLLWDRRTTVETVGQVIEVMSLPDLVLAKKTQRDEDWVMVVRLLEANYFANQDAPSKEQVEFWLLELRTPILLIEVANRFPEECRRMARQRPLLKDARPERESVLRAALKSEESEERQADRLYWKPLRDELERLEQDSSSTQ